MRPTARTIPSLAMNQFGAVYGERGEVDRAIPLVEHAPRSAAPRSACAPRRRNSLLFSAACMAARRLAPLLFDQAGEPAVGAGHPGPVGRLCCKAGVQAGRLPESRDAIAGPSPCAQAQGPQPALYMPLFAGPHRSSASGDCRRPTPAWKWESLPPAVAHDGHAPVLAGASPTCAASRGEPLVLPFAGDQAEKPVRREAAKVLALLYKDWGKKAEAARYRALFQSLPADQTLEVE